jgi:uncharacterized protein
MKIACISDTHGQFDQEIPEADLYIFAGDLTNYGMQDFVSPQIINEGYDWLCQIASKGPLLAVRGNHDIAISKDWWESIPGLTYVNHKTYKYYGLKFHGESQTVCFDAPYMKLQWTDMTDDPALDYAVFSFGPVDIVISHGPPFSLLDNAGYDIESKAWVHIGSLGLLEYINTWHPMLVICGHVHSQYGRMTYGSTEIVNTAGRWTIIEIDTKEKTINAVH